jgi:hypothetical protein
MPTCHHGLWKQEKRPHQGSSTALVPPPPGTQVLGGSHTAGNVAQQAQVAGDVGVVRLADQAHQSSPCPSGSASIVHGGDGAVSAGQPRADQNSAHDSSSIINNSTYGVCLRVRVRVLLLLLLLLSGILL